jgi:hypothetical protein
VADDVFNGYFSDEAAREIYGVVADREAFMWDESATEERKRRSARGGYQTCPSRRAQESGKEGASTSILSSVPGGEAVCAVCGQVFGPQDENYKLQAAEEVRDFRDVGLLRRDQRELTDAEAVFTQYLARVAGQTSRTT